MFVRDEALCVGGFDDEDIWVVSDEGELFDVVNRQIAL